MPDSLMIPYYANLCRMHSDGRHWYTSISEMLRATYGPNATRMAELLAITSPRCHVKLNVRRALALFAYGPMVARSKSLAMPHTVRRAVETYYQNGTINGRKTGPFARNLCGDLEPATVDTWIGKLLYPHAFMGADTDASRGSYVDRLTGKEHRAAISTIESTARVLHWYPAEVQAALWYASMRQHGRTPVCMATELQYFLAEPSHIL